MLTGHHFSRAAGPLSVKVLRKDCAPAWFLCCYWGDAGWTETSV